MSLVNDMLSDLDERRGKQAPADLNLEWLDGQQKKTPQRFFKPLFIITLLCSLLLLAAVAWIYQPAATLESAAAVINQSAQPVQPLQQQPVIKQKWLSTLQFTHHGDVTTAVLKLSESLPYLITRVNNTLELTFTGAENRLQASDLKTLNPIIALSVSESELATVLLLKIDGDFSYSDKIVSDSGYRFELRIRPFVPPSNEPVAVQIPVVSSSIAKTLVATELVEAGPHSSKITLGKSAETVVSTPTPTPKQSDTKMVSNARQLLHKGRPFDAERQLENFLSGQPQALKSAKLLMTLWLSRQHYEPLQPLLNRLRIVHSSDVDLLVLQARLYLAKAQAEKTVELLMTAQPDIQRYSDYYELLALAARQSQQYQLSEQAYRGLVNSDPLRGDWWVGLGIALDAQGQLTKARRVYQQALKTNRISQPLHDYAQQRLLE